MDKFKTASALAQHVDTNSCGVLEMYKKAEIVGMLAGEYGGPEGVGWEMQGRQ